jgi:gluconate 2-dehydrogenase gamma chain
MSAKASGLSRRTFLQVSGAAAVVPAATEAAKPPPQQARGGNTQADAGTGYLFFNAPEAAFIEAAVVRLIPPDEVGPSAIEAGVPIYLDRQLHGAWGAGERLFRGGPWQPGTPQQGYQLPLTPAEMYRTALRAIRTEGESGGTPFEKMNGDQQDSYLTALQTGNRDLGGVPSNGFFESLLAMTIEGYFCDPVYGGNRDMAAWRMIGFPGAYGAYYDVVDRYGMAFDHPPRSLGENAGGHVAMDPNIPAKLPAGNSNAMGAGAMHDHGAMPQKGR